MFQATLITQNQNILLDKLLMYEKSVTAKNWQFKNWHAK